MTPADVTWSIVSTLACCYWIGDTIINVTMALYRAIRRA